MTGWRANRYARARTRETREYEAGHHRERQQADEILHRGDDVAEERLRMHVAVADGGGRLDAEEEEIGEAARPRIGDRRRRRAYR